MTAPKESTYTPQAAATANFPDGKEIQIDYITMTSLTDGWGIGGALVLVTANGGNTWREVSPPVVTPPEAEINVYATFLDKQNAWAIFSMDHMILPEASVWHTTDGGISWSPGQPLLQEAFGEYFFADLSSVDASNIWILVSGVSVGAGTHYNNQLLHSVDGGINWLPSSSQVNWNYNGMVFKDASYGWLTWELSGFYTPAPPQYAITEDEGATWEEFELFPPADASGLFNEYAHCGTYNPVLLSTQSIRVVMGCSDDCYPPHQFISYLYESEDCGNSWITHPLPETNIASESTLIYFDT